MAELLDKVYHPEQIESRWYKYWEESGLFRAEAESQRPPYSIVIPPPNITGSLHMGHALNNTLQDILIRFKRMQGYNVLWMPGTDHAGIATQNVVEKMLAAEGQDRYTLGREAFVARVWKWKTESGGRIISQLKRLGCSCDWSRERFTMDEGLSAAVREVFVRLYEEGLIYKGDYIINWCPRCQTALADLEVEHETKEGHLYYIKYPLAGKEGHLTVATTRPETMLGDTAVAVNPDDPRYQKYHGATLTLPILARKIPLITDSYVTTEFGTGALKVTPAHDLNDFEIARRHQLPAIQVINERGRMTEAAGKYEGMDRFACREKIVKDLKADGLLEKIEKYSHSVGHCYRCGAVVEPMFSKQWFVAVKPLAAEAVAAVQAGRIKIIPQMWEKTYFEWMSNIRDWCISRQIWWGHRIPAWTCSNCQQLIVARETPSSCPHCQKTELVPETDVLDTWFSSALWPFSTLGWPQQTPELKLFYPTSVLVTAFDILFFWVARMMMMGLHFMHEVPFREVYIHALVRDAEGQKMSKSKGNIIDPLEIMDKYGTDAFRFSLAAFAAMGRDVLLSEERIIGYRNFVNKVWNASRFTLMNLEGYDPEAAHQDTQPLTTVESWIISRLQRLTQGVGEALDSYKFDHAAHLVYQFTWHEFCDWYLEFIKPALYESAETAARRHTQRVLTQVLGTILRLLHPFMPFITEEVWHKLPGVEGSIMVAPFPQSHPELINPDAEAEMGLVMEVVTAIRNIRAEMNVPLTTRVKVDLFTPHPSSLRILRTHRHFLRVLARVGELNIEFTGQPPRAAAKAVVDTVEIYLPLSGILDFSEEDRRLAKEMEKLSKDLTNAQKKLANEDFLAKAPEEVVEREKEKVHVWSEKLAKLRSHREKIRELMA
ncbi:MAG: valine--tRNA ligase [Deltaproteobacteria bacterium]|nr:valine--tRNA ligase [Deltaproteobacteria bacterium]MBW1951858.1 valine--tRNA ligase [Deltaproteobacteria bacterium]MBW1986562.1 valine--tRNA ligase [Deltaproteobacteria bacterium]MBW2134516.1 valine--tRNA ligase [Deltaproteobacteria bacterium]